MRAEEATTPRDTRIFALDYVRAAAIVAVAVTHAVPLSLEELLTRNAMVVFAITAFHVPSFLFVSGFLSASASPTAEYVASRLRRILVPYVVASVLAYLSGVATSTSVLNFAYRLVTGSMLGHYYFIPVLGTCFLLVPLLSRIGDRGLVLTWIGLTLGAVVLWTRPTWRPGGFFWAVRDPILQFHFGFFVSGTIAGRWAWRDPGSRFFNAYAGGLVAACVTAGWIWVAAWHSDLPVYPLLRIAYTGAVIATIAACTANRHPPRIVRFLSEASLPLYLYHWFAYVLFPAEMSPSSLALRILLVAPVGLAFASLVALAGRRILGERSRLLIGY